MTDGQILRRLALAALLLLALVTIALQQQQINGLVSWIEAHSDAIEQVVGGQRPADQPSPSTSIANR